MQALVGLRKYDAGSVEICGQLQNHQNYHKTIEKGIVLVPEDRKKLGLVLINHVAFNTTLAVLKEFMVRGTVNRRKENEIIDNLVQKGITIIMVSSDLNEVINMSDRVIVMKEGRITGTLKHEEINQEAVMHMATYEGGGNE